jgi:hypothetical protein
MNVRNVAWLAAVAAGLAPLGALAREKPELILTVVRLKPGEAKKVELALPYNDFRPGGQAGRDSLGVALLPRKGAAFEARTEVGKKAFAVSPGLEVVWVEGRPEVEFRADRDARPGMIDLRVTYESFAGGAHVAGFRVVIAPD